MIDEIFERRKYNRLARPAAKEEDALEVKFGVALQQIVDVVRDVIRNCDVSFGVGDWWAVRTCCWWRGHGAFGAPIEHARFIIQ